MMISEFIFVSVLLPPQRIGMTNTSIREVLDHRNKGNASKFESNTCHVVESARLKISLHNLHL